MVLVEERVELSAHGSGDQLERYALGRLPAAEIPQLEEHLLACSHCREKVDELEAVGAGFRQALIEEAHSLQGVMHDQAYRAGVNIPGMQDRRKQSFSNWLIAAARRPAVSMALAFAVLIVLVAFFSHGRTSIAPVATLQLTAVRSDMPATVPARRFELTLADGPTQGGPFRVEVVNAVGASMWQGLAATGPAGVGVDVRQRLGQGDYFVRLYAASGTLLREYGFRVRN